MEPTFEQLAVAVLLGLLVGLQREHAASGHGRHADLPADYPAGQPLGLLANHFGDSWILAAGLLGVVGVTVVGHLFRPQPDPHPGTTTDVAMLLMYAVGALVVIGPMPVAIAVGGGVAVLLQFKPELHGIAQKLGDEDLRAIMQFVLITCIILPVLPDRNFGPSHLLAASACGWPSPGPLDVLNPYWTWLMVVLIVGLSLGGLHRLQVLRPATRGFCWGGFSAGRFPAPPPPSATPAARRGDPIRARTASIVIMIASTVMYVRIMAAVAVVSPEFLQTLAPPMWC